MAWEDEMQAFTRSLFRSRPDLSTLTHSVVRRRFLAHTGRDHLEAEQKQALKRLVEEELLKMQVDEAGAKKAKRPPSPCGDTERKRFRCNSGSDPSSTASSPDRFGSPAENGPSVAEVGPGEEEKEEEELEEKKKQRQSSRKRVEESSDEQEQQDLPAKTALQEGGSQEEGCVRDRKLYKEESSEEEDEEKDSKGRPRKKSGTQSQLAAGEASVERKQARSDSDHSREAPAQRTARRVERKKGAKNNTESNKESEEEEDWKPKAGSRRRSAKRDSRPLGASGDSSGGQSPGAASSEAGRGSNSDEEPLVRLKSKEGTHGRGGSSQDGADVHPRVGSATEGPAKTANLGGTSDEDSDLEREGSDSEAPESVQERKNRSARKSSRKGRARSCSSSSSSGGSPESKGRKVRAGSGRRGEDHPAVTRLKRYIRACGAHRNYKKLLGSCRSHKERLNVLRAELEALGMKGNPTLEKCRALKEQRETAAEVASLDVANIISSSGRSRRSTAWNPSAAVAPGELYRRTLDVEEGPRLAPTDWSHMRGIISSDGEST
ncbi:HIRA-interacting protein 3 isoform X3 [Ochotona princeps]|uniref:HIRA-interacting protein 3 isoform X3 n=1 Tax=Ochotona princeps TaxID=9978 RepID=UPI002714C5A0|nr:HIRA-interacting protein 3 isoform X3 [Ochotona princeps]